jgi:hypothetical protein
MEFRRLSGGRLNMMRTIEILIVIIIITGAFIGASFFAVLPGPRQVSPVNLRRLSFTTLQMLDSDYALSTAAFDVENGTLWNELQIALSASLPPNVVYNLTVYEVQSTTSGSELYNNLATIANTESLGSSSDASSYLAASSNVTFNVVPEKIGEHSGGGTLYILNCSDAPGWWITGYTAHSLAQDLYNLLSSYFSSTIMIQNTAELAQILDGNPLHGETLQNAVVINTCGEAVPIPSTYADLYNDNSYAEYFYEVGKRVNQYNWTWTSIVGWPFYYVSNTGKFSSNQNGWGIYGMVQVSNPGLNAFLQGLDNRASYDDSGTSSTSSPGIVYLSPSVLDSSNYYGIYPSPYQTSTRALSSSILTDFHLDVTTYVFNPVGSAIPAAIYRHAGTGGSSQGAFYAIGLTRTPDIRLTALGLLADYRPRLYRSEYTTYGTSRLVVLQIALVGGG